MPAVYSGECPKNRRQKQLFTSVMRGICAPLIVNKTNVQRPGYRRASPAKSAGSARGHQARQCPAGDEAPARQLVKPVRGRKSSAKARNHTTRSAGDIVGGWHRGTAARRNVLLADVGASGERCRRADGASPSAGRALVISTVLGRAGKLRATRRQNGRRENHQCRRLK